ncbi:MAG: protein translocase subunit SecD [Fimbriimonas sp.]
MRSKSYLFLLLVLGLGVLSGFLYSQTKYNYGLDVRGGIRLTYQMQLAPEQRTKAAEIRSRLISILTGRASGSLGVAEPSIVGKGLDQIVVELPGATDIESARKAIGTSAKIQFYHARTIANETYPSRPYRIAGQERGADPVVTFNRTTGAGTEIKPSDPEYQRIIRGWRLILEGEDLERAESQVSGTSFQPLMLFSREGAKKMERWSRANPQDNLAAVLDNRVLSIAPLQAGAILSDNAVINGQFDGAYVKSLTDLLNAGALPVDLKELSSERVDPTIGTQALDKMVLAGAIAFVVTAIFLIVYYSFAGFVALLALLLYVLFTLTVLKLANATFSLAAIAGFILSVGMAVDANILVFERFKEEMKRGRTLQTAIDLGFRRALPAIFDSNACTILTSLVLAYLGTGPVKGFATTLIMGVIISLFTAITVTRSLLMFFVNSGIGANPKWYAVERNLFFEGIESRANTDPLPIVQKAKRYFIISAISIVVLLPFIGIGGLKPNVEFRGGYEGSFSLAGKNLNVAQIQDNLKRAGIEGANVKTGGDGATRVAIVTAPAEGPLKGVSEAEALNKLTQGAGFGTADVRGSSSVGPAIQSETIRNAILAVVISSALIVFWLAIRFGLALGGIVPGLRFGLSAIGALVHDVLFVVGFTALVGFAFGWEISALFITSMLTVIGFSVHDTIVIFDRIRENLRKPQPGEDLARIMNRSISQSFARSVNTSMTVIATLIIMLVIGTSTPDLKLFCATMLAGILSGTYSSIYNAAPILYLWDRAVAKNKGEAQSLVGLARHESDRNRVVGTQQVAPPAETNTSAGGRSYGQVRRRANQPKPGHIEIEEDI